MIMFSGAGHTLKEEDYPSGILFWNSDTETKESADVAVILMCGLLWRSSYQAPSITIIRSGDHVYTALPEFIKTIHLV